MAKPKKQSKRMPARKKYKIQKKVREHERKKRKEAKQKAGSKRLKKDPGIPNLFPFKEQLLQQMQARKERAEGEKERQRLQRQREHAKRRSLQSMQNDVQKRTREFEKKGELEAEMNDAVTKCGLQSDQSLRAYYREFRRVVEASDVVLEVLDARDPLGCRCLQVENAILSAGPSKKLILVLNKIDLIPKEMVEKWLKYLRAEFPTVAFKASTQTQKHHLSQKKFPLGSGPAAMMGTSVCLGAEVLLKLLGNYCRNADIRTSISVGVVGLPNVGKSSLINSLKRSRVCNVGANPGLTKSLQEIQLDKHVKLIDSPGVIMASGGCNDTSALILRNCVKVESVADPISPVEAILRRCNKHQVMEHYCIAEFDGVQEFLSHLAHKTGRLRKGGVADVDSAARSVLRDWNTGKITFYTHPPEGHLSGHVSTEIVQQWGEAFDIDALVEEECKDLKGLGEVKGEMMEITPSEPLAEAFVETEEENTEEMLSDVSEDNSSEEDMEDSGVDQTATTVILHKKAKKQSLPSLTKKELKELERLKGPQQPGKERRKAQQRREKMIRQLETRCGRKDEDGDVILDDDAYNFDDHFQ